MGIYNAFRHTPWPYIKLWVPWQDNTVCYWTGHTLKNIKPFFTCTVCVCMCLYKIKKEMNSQVNSHPNCTLRHESQHWRNCQLRLPITVLSEDLKTSLLFIDVTGPPSVFVVLDILCLHVVLMHSYVYVLYCIFTAFICLCMCGHGSQISVNVTGSHA